MARSSERSIRDSVKYAKLQEDPRFKSWLRMQAAAMEIEFSIFDVPEVNAHMFTREGLVVLERVILEREYTFKELFAGDLLKLGGRILYFVGETFRREVEGTWVALPPASGQDGAISAIDAVFRPNFYNPRQMVSFALSRRTGTEISEIFDHAVVGHREWVEAGRPSRAEWAERRIRELEEMGRGSDTD